MRDPLSNYERGLGVADFDTDAAEPVDVDAAAVGHRGAVLREHVDEAAAGVVLPRALAGLDARRVDDRGAEARDLDRAGEELADAACCGTGAAGLPRRLALVLAGVERLLLGVLLEDRAQLLGGLPHLLRGTRLHCRARRFIGSRLTPSDLGEQVRDMGGSGAHGTDGRGHDRGDDDGRDPGHPLALVRWFLNVRTEWQFAHRTSHFAISRSACSMLLALHTLSSFRPRT
jgi:hypothetical protein